MPCRLPFRRRRAHRRTAPAGARDQDGRDLVDAVESTVLPPPRRAAWLVMVLIERRIAVVAAVAVRSERMAGRRLLVIGERHRATLSCLSFSSVECRRPAASGRRPRRAAARRRRRGRPTRNSSSRRRSTALDALAIMKQQRALQAHHSEIGLWVMKTDDASGSHKRSIGKTASVRARRGLRVRVARAACGVTCRRLRVRRWPSPSTRSRSCRRCRSRCDARRRQCLSRRLDV